MKLSHERSGGSSLCQAQGPTPTGLRMARRLFAKRLFDTVLHADSVEESTGVYNGRKAVRLSFTKGTDNLSFLSYRSRIFGFRVTGSIFNGVMLADEQIPFTLPFKARRIARQRAKS